MSPRKPKPKTAGIRSLDFTKMQAFGMCPPGYRAEHVEGRRVESPFRDFGGVVHEAIEEVNRKIKASKNGQIDARDLEKAKRRLAGWGRFAWYERACAWLTNYAQRMHEMIADDGWKIVAVEEKFAIEVVLDSGEIIRLAGKMDLELENPEGEPVFVEFKTWGEIPTEEDLEDDLQGSVYNALRRRRDNYLGVAWRLWYSVFHDKQGGPVKADVENANDAERFVKEMAERMDAEKDWEPRTNKFCKGCPDLASCAATARLVRAGGVQNVTEPKLAEYVKLGAQATLLGDLRETVRGLLVGRLEEAGGELTEDGLRAHLHDVKGGATVHYVTKPYTKLEVKPATLGERTNALRAQNGH